MKEGEGKTGSEIECCDNCKHSRFNGSDYVCVNGLSRYYGMGYLSRRKRKCELYEYLSISKRGLYG